MCGGREGVKLAVIVTVPLLLGVPLGLGDQEREEVTDGVAKPVMLAEAL